MNRIHRNKSAECELKVTNISDMSDKRNGQLCVLRVVLYKVTRFIQTDQVHVTDL